MKPDLRWQLLLAATGFILVLGLLSYQVQSAALCTVTVPASGGYLSAAMVGRPVALNPLLADAYPVDRQINDLIFDGLVRFDESGEPQPALAESWSFSEDGLTVRFVLRDGLTWHDGEPVTAADVAFTYSLMQQPDFPGPAALVQLWQSVTITPVDDRTIDFTLAQPYSPFLEATARGILPEHLLANVPVADLASAAFNRSPVGTGPFAVDGTQNWEQTGLLRLVPNPATWREGTQLSGVEIRFLPDETALLEGYQSGGVQLVTDVTPVLLPNYAADPSARLVASLAPQYSALLFNLDAAQTATRPTTNVNVRKAVAYALDRQALVDGTLNGQGVVFDGPYLPDSWAYDATQLTAYGYDGAQAAGLLDEAGWPWAEGQPFRQRDGRDLVLTLLATDSATHRALAERITQQLAAAGIGLNVQLVADWAEFRELLATRQFDLALTEVTPTNDPDLYDFWSQEAIIRGQNFPGWNNRRASEALESGRQTLGQAEREVFYDTFLRQFDADLPALTLYQHINTVGLSDTVQEAEIGRVDTPRDLLRDFASWFFRYRDVTVACPAAEATS
jgi:peptide/nickel transport system substrate-binding protein